MSNDETRRSFSIATILHPPHARPDKPTCGAPRESQTSACPSGRVGSPCASGRRPDGSGGDTTRDDQSAETPHQSNIFRIFPCPELARCPVREPHITAQAAHDVTAFHRLEAAPCAFIFPSCGLHGTTATILSPGVAQRVRCAWHTGGPWTRVCQRLLTSTSILIAKHATHARAAALVDEVAAGRALARVELPLLLEATIGAT